MAAAHRLLRGMRRLDARQSPTRNLGLFFPSPEEFEEMGKNDVYPEGKPETKN
jgi:hypothetical protein